MLGEDRHETMVQREKKKRQPQQAKNGRTRTLRHGTDNHITPPAQCHSCTIGEDGGLKEVHLTILGRGTCVSPTTPRLVLEVHTDCR